MVTRTPGFFHVSTVVRHRRNKIEGLFDNLGYLVDSKNDIRKVVADYFSNLSLNDFALGIPRVSPIYFLF